MNAVEIEAAVSELAFEPFAASEFPLAFLAAFGNKETTLKRLRTGNNNTSDLPGGVLLRNNIHIAVCPAGDVGNALQALRASPATTKAKARFILATDGCTLEAKELASGETIACDYPDFPDHFGFFLPLAGISTIKEIKDNPIDVRATGRLNKLYVELLQGNPEWAKDERRADMNHFMARLVFCFFAEDTGIFNGDGLFTQTVNRFSEPGGANTHEVMGEIFRAMNIKVADRLLAQPPVPNWANGFPYVNGGLFSGSTEAPRFGRMARTYLMHAGTLNWRLINPDIFGSMIQAVADDAERGALGMHYTSVPNILKVLNPLFLDDLRAQLDAAGDNKSKLLNLRKRMARIRVFDPACGSGNFLVIAYKQMRAIEAVVNERRGEAHLRSEIPLTNFRGIELRDFPAEIARLALIIAEFQCDVLYRGQQDALLEFLPLNAQNWIVCGNALRLDWLGVCPPTGTGVKLLGDDLFNTPLDQTEMDFANEGGETFICGNPPYLGNTYQTSEQKAEIRCVMNDRSNSPGFLDYVAGWFIKAADYIALAGGVAAFVSTNSICQGQSVPIFCVWIEDQHLGEAQEIPALRKRIEAVRELRLASPDKGARTILAKRPHQMKLMRIGKTHTIIVPIHSSENRPYLPVGLTDNRSTLTNATYGLYDAPLWNLALVASRLHLVWIATVCGKLKTDFRYSNTLGWNTFPVPLLTVQDKADLTACAEGILLAREAHFPATIADLYDPAAMPDNLRAAHAHNDETLERIYIGRRFKNDTERLEKLFELYTRMTAASKAKPVKKVTREKQA